MEQSEESTESAVVRAVLGILDATSGGAEGDDLEAAVTRLAEALGPDDAAGVSSLQERAAELQRDGERRRWREIQLQSLLDTAQELLTSAATDELLAEVVHATRRLVPSDIAHINLGVRDDEIIRRVRTSEGEFTEEWRRFRTEVGKGVTGRVFATNAPYVAHEYLTDPGIDHTDLGDETARRDGIRTMAGVPLRRGAEVVGALVASFRSPTYLSAEQLSIMGSLASLASAALEGARLESERLSALAELEAVNEQVHQSNLTLEWSAHVHDRLTQLGLASADLDAVVRQVGETFECQAAVFGPDGIRLTSTADDFPLVDAFEDGGGPHEEAQTVWRQTVGGGLWICPAVSNGLILASLVIDREVLSDIEQRTLERSSIICALLLANERALFEAQARDDASTVADLVAGGPRAMRASARARSLGLRIDHGCSVLVAEGGDDAASLVRQAYAFARASGGIAGEPEGRLTMLLPGNNATEPAESFLASLGARAAGVRVGAGEAVRSVDGLAHAFTTAVRCCEAISSLGLSDRFMTPAELGFAGLLLADPSPSRLASYIDGVLGPVLEYDDRRGTELIATMESYLRHSSSLQAVAQALHVHSNTAYQRLQRVSSLLGDDWQAADRLVEVQLALRLRALTERRPS
jgi:GAF domain-containing protein